MVEINHIKCPIFMLLLPFSDLMRISFAFLAYHIFCIVSSIVLRLGYYIVILYCVFNDGSIIAKCHKYFLNQQFFIIKTFIVGIRNV